MASSCTTSQCGTGSWGGPLPGDPDNSSLLSATSEFGGIRITWTLPNVNAYAVAYTKLYRSIGDDFATAIPYKFVAGNEYFDAQAADPIRGYYYWIQHVSVNGTELDPIGPVTSTAKPLLLKVLEDLQGQVEFTSLASDLRAKIDLITDLQNGLTQLNNSVTTENGLVNQQLTALQNDLDDTLAYISEREVIEANERQAFVQEVNTQLAAVGDNAEIYAAIEEEATTRATQTGELFAQKVLKVDLAGNISGYGLAASVDPDGNATSEFQVRADTFSIAPPALVSNTAPANPYNGMVWEDTSTSPTTVRWYNSTAAAWQTTPVKAAVPFIVKTVPEVVNGYLVEPGVYINAAFIGRLSADQIDTRGLEIRDDQGNVIFSADADLDWSRIKNVQIENAQIGDVIQHNNFVQGVNGWKLDKNGDVEINNLTARGNITANSLTANTVTTENLVADAVTNGATATNYVEQSMTSGSLGGNYNLGSYLTGASVTITTTQNSKLRIDATALYRAGWSGSNQSARVEIFGRLRLNGVVVAGPFLLARGTDPSGYFTGTAPLPSISVAVTPGSYTVDVQVTRNASFVSSSNGAFMGSSIAVLETKR